MPRGWGRPSRYLVSGCIPAVVNSTWSPSGGTSELPGITWWPRSPKNSRKVRVVSVTFMALVPSGFRHRKGPAGAATIVRALANHSRSPARNFVRSGSGSRRADSSRGSAGETDVHVFTVSPVHGPGQRDLPPLNEGRLAVAADQDDGEPAHQLGGPNRASAAAAVGLSGSDGNRRAW